MMHDLIRYFKKMLEREGQQILLNEHYLKDGRYIVVKKDDAGEWGNVTVFEIKTKKRIREISPQPSSQIYDYAFETDYYSYIMEANKAITPLNYEGVSGKGIGSNNYFTFFTKIKHLSGKNKTAMNMSVIEAYYNALKDETEETPSRNAEIDSIKTWVSDNIHQYVTENDSETMDIKFYFVADSISRIYEESKRYLAPRIFLSEKYMEMVDGETKGISFFNNSMGASKVTKFNKTRKTFLNTLSSEAEVWDHYLMNSYFCSKMREGKFMLYANDDEMIFISNGEVLPTNFNGAFVHLEFSKTEALIKNYVPVSTMPELRSPIRFENYVNVAPPENYDIVYRPLYKKEEILHRLNQYVYGGFLKYSMFCEPKDITNTQPYRNTILLSRDLIADWLYKNQPIQHVWKALDYSTQKAVEKSILEESRISTTTKLNTRIALKKYFLGDDVMKKSEQQLRVILKEKIDSEQTTSFADQEEFFYAAGQLISYLISKSSTKNKKHAMVNPFVKSKSVSEMKKAIRKIFTVVNHSINNSNPWFNNLYQMVLSWNGENGVDQDMLLLGYLATPVVYEEEPDKITETQEEEV